MTTSANWAGNYTYRARGLREPRSIEELQETVAASSSLTALGSRHSFNDIADSETEQVSLRALPAEFTVDAAERTATVAAGARYGEFVQRLHDDGWAIHNLASLPHISVAGAIATGTHGSGDANGSLSTAVAALELVTANGTLLTVRREEADFDGLVVALGALGIVTRVTLDIQPTFLVRQDVFLDLPWRELRDHFDEITSSGYSVSLFTDWGGFGATQVWVKSRIDDLHPAATAPALFGARRAPVQLHPLPGESGETTTEQLGLPGAWWDRLAHFKLEFTPSAGVELQSEYLVPREHALAAIDTVRALAPRISPHLFVSELRTMAADSLWLSPASGRETVGIHFTWKQHEEVAGLLPVIEAALAPFAARPHWGKLFTTDATALASLYPRLPAFRELADRLDPDGVFRNDYLRRTVLP